MEMDQLQQQHLPLATTIRIEPMANPKTMAKLNTLTQLLCSDLYDYLVYTHYDDSLSADYKKQFMSKLNSYRADFMAKVNPGN